MLVICVRAWEQILCKIAREITYEIEHVYLGIGDGLSVQAKPPYSIN